MKWIKRLVFTCFLFIIIPVAANASEKIDLYLFWGDGCPHCAHEKEFLNDLQKEDSDIEIHSYEVWNNEKNAQLLEKVKTSFGDDATLSVPYTVIGNKTFVGYGDSTKTQISSAIETCHNEKCEDQVYKIIKDEDIQVDSDKTIDEEVTLPLLGRVNVKEVSLPLIAIVIGVVDGFNPCAMWILLFLISMLLGMKNKKRMWAIGLTFLITSAIVYLLFMLTWLSITLKISDVVILRTIIAMVALIGGFINLRAFLKSKNSGCEVVKSDKRKNILERIKKITGQKSFILALLGVMALAFTVNLIELACSAGLPLLFTQILALNDLSNFQYMSYMLIYVLFFLLDDLVIFVIAMLTLQVTGITTKYNKYSHLIGGVLMILIGMLLIFKPEWIMFNF